MNNNNIILSACLFGSIYFFSIVVYNFCFLNVRLNRSGLYHS